eukprot:540012-Amorphochlora_amoeboformis.AAC.1
MIADGFGRYYLINLQNDAREGKERKGGKLSVHRWMRRRLMTDTGGIPSVRRGWRLLRTPLASRGGHKIARGFEGRA